MDSDLLLLEHWDKLNNIQCKDVAIQVARNLPDPFKLKEVRTCQLGQQQHNVAFFDWNNAQFALVPGGEIQLGYDRNHPYQPSEIEAKDWKSTSEDYELGTLEEFLDKCLTPLRTVTIKPFLAESSATLLGVGFPLYPYSPNLRELAVPFWTSITSSSMRVEAGNLEEFSARSNLQVANDQIIIEVYQQGQSRTIVRPASNNLILAEMNQSGFRVPTFDEWEYMCGTGSQTLFRWGNYCPEMSVYSEANAILLSEKGRWNLHYQPNAFGLRFVNNTYDVEVCEGNILRGGDGGGAYCGGMGWFISWLSLATSFFDEELFKSNGDDVLQENGYYRRIYPLAS